MTSPLAGISKLGGAQMTVHNEVWPQTLRPYKRGWELSVTVRLAIFFINFAWTDPRLAEPPLEEGQMYHYDQASGEIQIVPRPKQEQPSEVAP